WGGWVGSRWIRRETQSDESPPHPLAALATSPRTRGEMEPAARSMLSSPVERVGWARREDAPLPTLRAALEQEAVVLELHARDLARAHGAQELRERDGGVGGGEALGADVGDAVALRVGGLRRGPKREIGAHAVGGGQARQLADQHDRDVGAQRVRDFIADGDAALAHHHE